MDITKLDYSKNEWDPFLRASPLTKETAQFIFETMMRRSPRAEFLEKAVKQGTSVADFETMLSESPEYKLSGRVMMDRYIHGTAARLVFIPAAKLIYCPIAKIANTSIKEWALRLSGYEVANVSDIHMTLDEGVSNLHLHHWSYAFKSGLAQSGDWQNVAVLRNPFDRLVSCYSDKFGRTRNNQATIDQHTAAVYRYFNDGKLDAEIVNRGISFRQFCQYINHTPREIQDWHWAPQWGYTLNFRFHKLFALEDVAKFEEFVQSRLPEEKRNIPLQKINVAPKRVETDIVDFSDALPGQWVPSGKPPTEYFLTPDIRTFIENYYSIDFDMYEKARAS